MAKTNSQQTLYMISVAAELAGMHPQTLRIYERKGLLDPQRTGGGSRRYSDFDIQRLHRIHELSNAGIGLEGIKRIIALEEEIQDLRQKLTELSSIQSFNQASHGTTSELVHIESAAMAMTEILNRKLKSKKNL